MLKVKVKSEEELFEVAKKAITILNNLRRTTSFWELHFGSVAKIAKKRYEKQADDFLRSIEVTEEHSRVDQIDIIIKRET